MISKYLCLAMCLGVAFGRRIIRENPNFLVSDELNKNLAMNVNSSVESCDDFYAYACGKYAENHPNVNYQEITSFMDYQYNRQLLNLMNNHYQEDSQIHNGLHTFAEKTRIYFKSCRITTKRDIKKYLEEIKPAEQLNWPIWQPQQWQANAEANTLFDVWSLVGRIHSYGMNNVLINQQILVQENGTFSIMLEPAFPEVDTTLPDVFMMRVLLRNLGTRNTEKILENLLQLNEDLLRVRKFSEDGETDSVILNYGQLHTAYPQLNLKQYFRELFRKELPATTLILIRKPKYLQQLNDNMWQTFKRRSMCNYLMLKFLDYLVKASVTELTDLGCIKELRNKMDVSVNFLYKTHILSKSIGDINKDIGKLQRDILHQYDTIFNENHLELNPQQLQLLRQKLHSVAISIGNLPFNSSRMSVDDYYLNLPPLDEKNYFKNHLLLLRHRFEKSLLYTANQTHYIVVRDNEGSDSGARYVAKQNMIVLPFGSLQMPLYNVEYQPLLKFSLLAFILAHEYAHAFDAIGLNFNGNGVQSADVAGILKEPNFQNSLHCLQSQLSTNSIDERLADIVASRVAYNLFKFHPRTKELLCPAEVSSAAQAICDGPQRYFYQKRFYLNMAQFFCGKSQLKFVDHDSDAERLRQIAINSEGFAEAFNCSVGSKMNPQMKCRVY